jgi:chemotaxis protein MotA
MFSVIGMGVVVVSVIGGYLLEHGNLHVLVQPAELIIIFGASIGSFLIASPGKVAGLVFKRASKVFAAKAASREHYIELLLLLNQLFWKIRKEGLLAIEADIENASQSELFKRYQSVISNHHALDFICDNFRVIITTNMPSHELDNLLELDIETHHHEQLIPANSISKVADALPGLGIVAAVLGVVLTMGKISEPPEVLGHHIGAALVGTFLGVLACYGFVSPMAANLEHQAKEEETYFNVIRTSLVAFVGGAAPQIAVESGRRAIPGLVRPSFAELEDAIKKWKDRA